MDVAQLAKTHGAENMIFTFPASPLRTMLGMISFTSSDDEEVLVEAKAVERPNRFVAGGFKMVLQPLDEQYASRDFYICDFESLMREYPERYSVRIQGAGDAA